MASSERIPVAASPSPSRTMREKASTTRNPAPGRPRDQQPAIVGAEVERGILRREPVRDRPRRGRRPDRSAGAAAPADNPSSALVAGAAAGLRKPALRGAPRPPTGLSLRNGFSTASNPSSTSTTADRSAAGPPKQNPAKFAEIPDAASCSGVRGPYPKPPRCAISRRSRPAEAGSGTPRMGDRLTVGQRTLTPPV